MWSRAERNWAGVRPPRWCGEWLCPVSLWLVFCSNLLGSLCEPVDGASVPSAMWETNASVRKKKRMFYLICCFNLPLYFHFFCSFFVFFSVFIFVIQGFKVQSSYSLCGDLPTCTPFKCDTSLYVGPNHVCQNCMYIPLSMLWILTVHKKYEDNSGIGCISINLEEKMKMQKSRVTDLYPKKKKKLLMGADRIFAAVYKSFNTICSFWLVAVLQSQA